MPLTKSARDVLGPYLETTEPNDQNEIGLKCPMHQDTKRSASLNVEKGVWFCNACGTGGTIRELVKEVKEGRAVNDLSGAAKPASNGTKPTGKFPYTDDHVKAWQVALLNSKPELDALQSRRGLDLEILDEFEIGWDGKNQAYTIPVRNNDGELANIRWYQLDPADDRRKIWGVSGFNEPVLYPIDQLTESTELVVCEGEWDALICIQNGLHAITRTGAAKVWKPEWNQAFAGLDVIICHDSDETGQVGNRKVYSNLKHTANSVQIVHLPYEVTEKHGKDLSDFFMEGNDKGDFMSLVQLTEPAPAREMVDVRVIDSFNSDRFGDAMRMRVTVTGKRNPPYMVPMDLENSCSMDAGPKCKGCPLKAHGGVHKVTVAPNDPVILSMLDATSAQIADLVRVSEGYSKCGRLIVDVEKYQTVEEIFVRPNVDVQLTGNDAGDYTTRRVFVVGPHDTLPNTTIELVGAIHANPRNQKNEFLAWLGEKVETSIDKFEVTRDVVDRLSAFRPSRGQPVLHKMEEIADDLAHNITHVYGRTNLHMFADVIFHSVLSFSFLGQPIYRGWLDGIVVGDTRTGKSLVAEQMIQHYGLGEMVSCESASFAGLVGGLQQLNNQAWEVTWGAIPLQDRRIVVMDEVSGLTPENIAQMSSIRSSGEAQLTKIRSERTYARTRLLWLGNPRNSRMADYTYGCQAIPPLIGNNEDVARFDLALAVKSGEVEASDINTSTHGSVPHVYGSELCHDLLLWAWSRTADQIHWADGSEQSVLDAALSVGGDYGEEPPLVQAANVRIKLARIAVAFAARTFSADRTGEILVVNRSHVEAAVEFLTGIYNGSVFGYLDMSREQILDERIALQYADEMEEFLEEYRMLAKFLRSSPKFKRQDLEDVLNLNREEASGIIQNLWEKRMFRRDGPYIKCTVVFQDILRRTAP